MSYAALAQLTDTATSGTNLRELGNVTGVGLITGLPVSVTIAQAPVGSGIVFHWVDADGTVFPIPARLATIVNTERGVTLASGDPRSGGKTLSIVEHFLCACALTNQMDLVVTVKGAPELPLLDGSAQQWVELLGPGPMILPDITLNQAVFYRHNDAICIYAVPSDEFQVSYSVDFGHPGLNDAWIHIKPGQDNEVNLAEAQTFGFVRELPILQAQGLAKGVTIDNTLGLTDDGGFTRLLKYEAEPIYHKTLDLIGDLTLMGINPLRIKAHIYAVNAGHDSHTAFAKQLLSVLPLG